MSIGAENGQGAAPAGAGLYRYYVLAALLVVYTLNYLDRQFLTVLVEPVEKSLHLSDTQMGALTGPLFAVFYTVLGIPIGLWADRANRVRIVALACTVWSLFTAACGFATGFVSLAIPRMGVGVGEAGGSPPAYSILSDYFPPRRRGVAMALYSLGVPFGFMFGALSGGYIAAHYGWQTAFKALGVMGLVVAPIFYLTVREPPRGRFDASDEPPGDPLAAILLFFRRPVLGLTALSAAVTAFFGYGVVVWTPALLIRAKHMSLDQVAVYYALSSGAAGIVGTLLSGVLVDWLGQKRAGAYALVPAAAMLLSLPFTVGAVLAPTWPIALAFLMGPSLFNNMFLPAGLAVVQNHAPVRQRVVSGALLLFAMNLVGLGGGPLFVGFMSDRFKPYVGAARGLEYGMLCLAPVAGLAVVIHLVTGHVLEREARKSTSPAQPAHA